MARQKLSAEEIVERVEANPNMTATITKAGNVQFRDGNGKVLNHKTAMVRQRAFEYRQRHPEDARESSRKYAEKIRRLAGVQPRGTADSVEVDED